MTMENVWRSESSLRMLVPALPTSRTIGWQRSYALALVGVDLAAIILAIAAASLVRFQSLTLRGDDGSAYLAYELALVPCWLGVMALSRGYDRQILGHGPEEFKRGLNALVRFTAASAGIAYLSGASFSRPFFTMMVFGVALLALLGRLAARQVLRRLRAKDRAMRRVLIVGTAGSAFPMAARLVGESAAGFHVVGLCAASGADRRAGADAIPRQADRRSHEIDTPVVGNLDDIPSVVRFHDIDTVAVAPSAAMSPEALRDLAWELESTGVDLIVAPALIDVAGPRIHVSPVAGLPLLHISTPRFTGLRSVLKKAQDVTVAGAALLVLSPVFLVVGLAIRLDSPGPVFFTQSRVGQGGRTFTMVKFRSMFVDAEARLRDLQEENKHGAGPLFKMEDDPRVTRVGAFLRTWSLDELPQMLNVLLGHMSLVGPRPPLQSEVLSYDSKSVYRRLMVKPGLTGLWQVSGRADLPWHEAVRLDLYYVENWSPALDVSILWRTAGAVLQRRGAY